MKNYFLFYDSFTSIVKLLYDLFITKLFYPKARLIRNPFYIRGKKRVNYGNYFTTGVGCRIDVFPLGELIIGSNVQINDYVHIACAGLVTIGDNVLIASRVFITDHDHGSFDSQSVSIEPYKRELRIRNTTISNNVWIGEGASILSGVTIGENSIIAAGAVVVKNVESNVIVAGVPAKIVKRI